MFGSATELELHNSSIFLNDDIVGDDSCLLADGSHGRIGVAVGEVVNSEIRHLSIDLNSKDINLEKCQYVGIVSGRSVNSTLSHIEIKNGGELHGPIPCWWLYWRNAFFNVRKFRYFYRHNLSN